MFEQFEEKPRVWDAGSGSEDSEAESVEYGSGDHQSAKGASIKSGGRSSLREGSDHRDLKKEVIPSHVKLDIEVIEVGTCDEAEVAVEEVWPKLMLLGCAKFKALDLD